MYLNNNKVMRKKFRNTIFLIVGSIGLIIFSFIFLAFLLDGDYEMYVLIFLLFILIFGLFILIALRSQKLIESVYFYSRYFEGDLDGYIKTSDIVDLIGKSEEQINYELNKLIKKKYMKNVCPKSNGKDLQIILISKISKCECRRCGATIDKRIYFTGKCPYCGSSDIFAKLL